MCKYLSHTVRYLEVSWLPIRTLQISLQENFSERLGAKLPSSISVCGETLPNSSYYTKISQQDFYPPLHCSIQTVEKKILALEYSQ